MLPRRLLSYPRRAVRHATRSVAEPLAVPDGWHTGPPDFVGVGAQRAGTTWWWRLLVDHPRVEGLRAARRRLGVRERPVSGRSLPAPPEGSLPKELHFFDAFPDGVLGDDDRTLYERFFARPPGSLAGEWTPRYMHDFWAPDLLRRSAPETKILVLLRDPVERFRSGVGQEARAAAERGRSPWLMAWNDALDRGRYATQLARLFEHFQHDRVLVLQYERCRADPRAELRRTYDFLGLAGADHLPAHLEAAAGRIAPKPQLDDQLRRSLVASLCEEVERLPRLVPELDLELWPNFRDVGRG